MQADDTRLPHLAQKITNQIHKTALGAEESVECQHHEDIVKLIESLKDDGFALSGLSNMILVPRYLTLLLQKK